MTLPTSARHRQRIPAPPAANLRASAEGRRCGRSLTGAGSAGGPRGCTQCHAPFPHPVRNVSFAYPFMRALFASKVSCVVTGAFCFFRSPLGAVYPSAPCVGRLYPHAPAVTSCPRSVTEHRHLLRPRLGLLAKARARVPGVEDVTPKNPAARTKH